MFAPRTNDVQSVPIERSITLRSSRFIRLPRCDTRADKTLQGVKYILTDVMSSAATSSRKDTKLDRTRRRILDAAAALLRKHGPTSVTMADVAHSAGLSRQAVYLHFESRAKLMIALLRPIGEQSNNERPFA